MMKFFRKHNKTLLAVFGVLLMVVFVGGSALQNMLTPSSNRKVANSVLGPITERDQQIARNATDILDSMGVPWRRPAMGARQDLELVDWILLNREANRLGIESSAARVRASISDPAFVDQTSRVLRIKAERIYDAWAQLDAVQQAARVVGSAAAPSEAVVRAAAAKTLTKVKVNAVVLPATAFADESEGFPEKEIQEHFAKYAERKAGAGLNFGYYLEPAIKVQYIRIDRDAVAAGVKVANMERRAKEYFDENRQRDPAFARANAEGPIAPPADDDPTSAKFFTWDEAREIAEKQVRAKEADQVVAKIADWVTSQAGQPWLDIARGESGYKEPPAAVAEPGYYDTLVSTIPSGFAIPGAVTVGVTEFVSEADAGSVPELGEALFIVKGSYLPLTFKDLAFTNQLLIPEVPDEKGVRYSDYLSAYQTCRYSLRNSDANVFVFRVIESREGQAPTSIDQVRDKVLADMRLQAGYVTAQYRADSLRSCDVCENLKEAYELDVDLVAMGETLQNSSIGYYEPAAFSRASQTQAAQGAFTGPVFVGGGVPSLPPDAVEACFALADASDKTATLHLDDSATIVVVEWVETQPAQVTDFERIRKSFVDQITRLRTQEAMGAWLNPDNIRARNEFKLATK